MLVHILFASLYSSLEKVSERFSDVADSNLNDDELRITTSAITGINGNISKLSEDVQAAAVKHCGPRAELATSRVSKNYSDNCHVLIVWANPL